MARPTKLTKEVVDKAIAYYDSKKLAKETPFVEELAIYYLDIDRHTVNDWCNKADDKKYLKGVSANQRALLQQFSSTIKRLADMQLLFLKIRGLKDKGNAMAIFLMKANHNMVETNRYEHSGPGGQPMEFKEVTVVPFPSRKG